MKVKELVIRTTEGNHTFNRPGQELDMIYDVNELRVYDSLTKRNYHYPFSNLISYAFTTKEDSK